MRPPYCRTWFLLRTIAQGNHGKQFGKCPCICFPKTSGSEKGLHGRNYVMKYKNCLKFSGCIKFLQTSTISNWGLWNGIKGYVLATKLKLWRSCFIHTWVPKTWRTEKESSYLSRAKARKRRLENNIGNSIVSKDKVGGLLV